LKKILEICCPNIDAAIIAEQCGADRIEFCKDLSVGGVTPTFDEIKEIKSVIKIPIHVLIRCRSGNFIYTDNEINKMVDEIKFCNSIGINGVVIGALKLDNTVDVLAIKKMIPVANTMAITFHKAFDEIKNQTEALQQLIDFNFTRILTSGGKATAILGAEQLKTLNHMAENKITIMPGGGIRSNNLTSLIEITNCKAFHSAAAIANGNDIFKNEIMKMKAQLEIV
jgi:copper homeostasis protein